MSKYNVFSTGLEVSEDGFETSSFVLTGLRERVEELDDYDYKEVVRRDEVLTVVDSVWSDLLASDLVEDAEDAWILKRAMRSVKYAVSGDVRYEPMTDQGGFLE